VSEGISIGQEEEFVDAYARALDRQHRDTHVVSLVRDSISIFRGIHPGESILSHAHSTEWIAPWCTAQKAGRRVVRLRLQAVGRWLRWLFEERHIDDNVLGYVPATVALAAGSPMLVLRCNLQRSIETYLGERRLRRADSLKSYRYYPRDFNVFVNRSQPGDGARGRRRRR
jgi:hypothetical protein